MIAPPPGMYSVLKSALVVSGDDTATIEVEQGLGLCIASTILREMHMSALADAVKEEARLDVLLF